MGTPSHAHPPISSVPTGAEEKSPHDPVSLKDADMGRWEGTPVGSARPSALRPAWARAPRVTHNHAWDHIVLNARWLAWIWTQTSPVF